MKEQLRELMHRDPYMPFRITTTSGPEPEANHPDLVAVGVTYINVYAPRSDHHVILRLSQIPSLHVAQTA